MTVELTRLPSGLRVVTETDPAALSVSTGAWVGVGSRDERASHAGVSHFLEHLLFKGTANRSARAISEAVDRVGGDMNAFTSKEVTAYYTRLPATEWKLGVELLGDVLTSPALRTSDIEIEREVILEELHMDDDAHDDRVLTLLGELLFAGHPLGRETAGGKDTVATITPATVRAFFKRFYRPENLVVAASGPIDHRAFVSQVKKWFRSERGGVAPKRRRPASGPPTVGSIPRRIEQVHIACGMVALHRDDPDREALDIVVQVLGGGPSSRLFDQIREQRGLAYSVFAGSSSYSDAGAVSLYAATSPGNANEVVKLMREQLTDLATNGITADELAIAQGYLRGAFVLGLEDTASRMSRLAGHITARGAVRPVDDQLARYNAVTGADARRVAERVLAKPLSFAVVGPLSKKSARELCGP